MKSQIALAEAQGILERLCEQDRKQQRLEDPDDLYYLAILEGVEAALLTETSQTMARWEHVNQAINYLDRAVRHGYRNVIRIRNDAGFKPLWTTEPMRMEAVVRLALNGTERKP